MLHTRISNTKISTEFQTFVISNLMGTDVQIANWLLFSLYYYFFMLLVFQPMSHTFMPSVIHLYVNSNCVHFLF